MANTVEDKLMVRIFLPLRSKSKKFNNGKGFLSEEVVSREEMTENMQYGNSINLFKWY